MRIAIVNDNQEAQTILRQLVEDQPDCEIVWQAGSGEEAIHHYPCCPPDAVFMDLHLPQMNGVEATRRLMEIHPCAIVIVARSVEDYPAMVFEAMGYGAIDAVSIPQRQLDGSLSGQERLVKKINTIRKLIEPNAIYKSSRKNCLDIIDLQPSVPDLIAIGTSTGGPKALAAILSELPESFQPAIAIVQHVDPKFTHGLVEWLNQQSKLPVFEAKENQAIEPGSVYVAGTSKHLIVREGLRLGYSDAKPDETYKPSVDTFFRSAAEHWPKAGVALLLTGMGRDGSKGMAVLHEAGWYTIAQDESTSVVYGMPKAAIELNAAADILPIDRIASVLINHFNRKGSQTTHG